MKALFSFAAVLLVFSSFTIESNQIEICHVPPGNPGNRHTIKVSTNALSAHLAHGDYIGRCEDIIVVDPGDGNQDDGGIDPFPF